MNKSMAVLDLRATRESNLISEIPGFTISGPYVQSHIKQAPADEAIGNRPGMWCGKLQSLHIVCHAPSSI